MTIPISAVIGGSLTPYVDIAPDKTFTLVTLTPVDDAVFPSDQADEVEDDPHARALPDDDRIERDGR